MLEIRKSNLAYRAIIRGYVLRRDQSKKENNNNVTTTTLKTTYIQTISNDIKFLLSIDLTQIFESGMQGPPKSGLLLGH